MLYAVNFKMGAEFITMAIVDSEVTAQELCKRWAAASNPGEEILEQGQSYFLATGALGDPAQVYYAASELNNITQALGEIECIPKILKLMGKRGER